MCAGFTHLPLPVVQQLLSSGSRSWRSDGGCNLSGQRLHSFRSESLYTVSMRRSGRAAETPCSIIRFQMSPGIRITLGEGKALKAGQVWCLLPDSLQPGPEPHL